MSSSSINIQKKEFIEFYLKEGVRISGEFDYIINLSKYLLNVLRFDNDEIDKVVDITTQQLQEMLNDNKIKQQKINGFSVYKNSDGTTKYVDFFIEDGQVIPKYSCK